MPTRLIDMPFTRGIDESTDETVLSPPGMTELVNYRLTRAGRLEHRLGVSDIGFDGLSGSSGGSTPRGAKPQAMHGRFLAAGGLGFVASGVAERWVPSGSVSRFAPFQSFPVSYATGPGCSCASSNGITAAAVVEGSVAWVRLYDELTGAEVQSDDVAGNCLQLRIVACGAYLVLLAMDSATGDITAYSQSTATLPLLGWSAGTLIRTGSVASGFDVAPINSTTFLVSYENAGGSAVLLPVSAVTLTSVAAGVGSTDGAGAKYTTCYSNGTSHWIVWLNELTRSICSREYTGTTVLTPATAIITLGTATVGGGNYHPVIGGGSDGTSAVVGWSDTYSTASYSTLRTAFLGLSPGGAVTPNLGTTYGYYLASKPFFNTSEFDTGHQQPAVWLANWNQRTSDLDRSYFLMVLGNYSSVSNNEACSWDMSASPSAAMPVVDLLGATEQVCEVVRTTAPGQGYWQTLFPEAFRNLGTSSVQYKAQLYRFGDGADSVRARSRCVVDCQGSFVVLGGAPRFYDSESLPTVGISHGPFLLAASGDVGGGMTASATYRYVVALEYFDGKGQRQLGYVTQPYSVTLGAGDGKVNFEFVTPAMWAFPNSATQAFPNDLVIRLYRTAANSGTVFRFVAAIGASRLQPRGEVTYTDSATDASIAANEAVYVQVGNALSNYRAPPCRFGCEHEGRLVVAGGWNPYEFRYSKLFFPGEGIQFTESPSFVGTSPEPITGCASLDGSLVLFSERGIFAVSGDGPTDDGVGSFSNPRRLPGRVGCSDWRSVLVNDSGVFFRAADGIYLLPRGLAAAVFVGSPIRNALRMYPETLGAALLTRRVASSVGDHDSEQVLAWLVGDAESPTAVKIFVFSAATQTWSEYQLPAIGGNPLTVLGVWRDLANGADVMGFACDTLGDFFSSLQPGLLMSENPGAGYERDLSDTYEPLLSGSWKSGKVFPFGFGGRGSVRSVRLVGECLAATHLTPTVYSDADEAGHTGTDLAFVAGRFAVEIPLRRRDLAWFQIEVEDPAIGSLNRGAGLRFNGLSVEVEMEPGQHRSLPGDRSV